MKAAESPDFWHLLYTAAFCLFVVKQCWRPPALLALVENDMDDRNLNEVKLWEQAESLSCCWELWVFTSLFILLVSGTWMNWKQMKWKNYEQGMSGCYWKWVKQAAGLNYYWAATNRPHGRHLFDFQPSSWRFDFSSFGCCFTRSDYIPLPQGALKSI